jgi:hypothetical protein
VRPSAEVAMKLEDGAGVRPPVFGEDVLQADRRALATGVRPFIALLLQAL